jgi:hypothetical protein
VVLSHKLPNDIIACFNQKLAKRSHNDYDLCRNTKKEIDKDIPYG